MSTHTIKGLREEFKKVGKFHTPPELAQFLHDLIPEGVRDVYDPTCGAGSLLATFPDETPKYGQDIDVAALADAELLPGFHGHLGDVLTDPAWMDHKFHAIVANPPFSIPWVPAWDERWFNVPVLPTKGRADYAFLVHILHMLADDGVAAVLQFPGVLYRGGRERLLRKWLVTENLVDRVISIPGDTFTDTAIGTACLVLRKDREPGAPIVFENREHGVTAEATLADIEGEDWSLSVHLYAHEPEPVREPVDAWLLEETSRATACIRLRHELNFSRTIAELEGWEFTPFLDDLVAVISEFQEDAA